MSAAVKSPWRKLRRSPTKPQAGELGRQVVDAVALDALGVERGEGAALVVAERSTAGNDQRSRHECAGTHQPEPAGEGALPCLVASPGGSARRKSVNHDASVSPRERPVE